MISGSKLALMAALVGSVACTSGRHSTSAFHLPPDGDVDRGKAAFVSLGCSNCHEVNGVNLPKPTVQPNVPVKLGGAVGIRLTDAYLVTSIVYPNHDLAPYPKNEITIDGQSRMPHYPDTMTIRQLTDIVAFLQSTYYVSRQPDDYGR